MRTKHFVFTLGTWLMILFIAGCGGYGNSMNNNPPPPPGVSNMADHFQFQVASGTYSATTKTFDYVWSNSGTSAKVTNMSSIAGGTAVLQISDSMGTQVLQQDLTSGGTFVTATGVTGDWKIEVVLTGVKGTVSFHVDKL